MAKIPLEEYYINLKVKQFFPNLVEYMQLCPVCFIVQEGIMQFLKEEKYCEKLSHLILIGTIRGDLCVEIGGNI